jgi:hypothetical protein
MEKDTNRQTQQSPQEAMLDVAPLVQTFFGVVLSACQHQPFSHHSSSLCTIQPPFKLMVHHSATIQAHCAPFSHHSSSWCTIQPSFKLMGHHSATIQAHGEWPSCQGSI